MRVRRTGGFAGLVADGEVDLDADDQRGPELAELVDRIDLREVAGGAPSRTCTSTPSTSAATARPSPSSTSPSDLRRVAELVLGG